MIGHFISYFLIPHVWSLAKQFLSFRYKFCSKEGKDCSVLTISACAVDCKRSLLAAIKRKACLVQSVSVIILVKSVSYLVALIEELGKFFSTTCPYEENIIYISKPN